MSIDLSPTERYVSGVSMRLASGSEPTANSQQHAEIFAWLTQRVRVRVSRRSPECALMGIAIGRSGKQMLGAHHCADQPTFCLALCGQALMDLAQLA
jgi:hypothetical protein